MNNFNLIKPLQVQGIINNFCVTIGMIPTTYLLSLSYEEQILAIGKYLEDTVYPAINKNAEALAEVQKLYDDLKKYFDNLNVQTEINNKLDEMKEDGTLEQIINQNIFNELNNEINNISSLTGSLKLFFPSLGNETSSQSIALLMSENNNILFDCGDASSYSNNLLALQNKLGSKKINKIIISHYHNDHVGGLQYFRSIIDDNAIVYLPLNPATYLSGSDDPTVIAEIRTSVINWLIAQNINYIEISNDTTLNFENDNFSIFLNNSSNQAYTYYNSTNARYNSYSMNATIHFGENKILFPGDSTVETQNYLMLVSQVEKVNIFVANHHGFERVLNQRYFSILNPDTIIYSFTKNMWKEMRLIEYYLGFNPNCKRLNNSEDEIEINLSKYANLIINGNYMGKNPYQNEKVEYYVDLTYNGTYSDGSQNRPFTSINHALNNISDGFTNVILHLANGTYLQERLYDIPISLYIYGDTNTIFEAPLINNCNCIYFNNINFTKGVRAEYSKAYFSSCNFTREDTSSDYIAIEVNRGNYSFNNCNFSSCYTGIYSNFSCTTYVNECTFNCSAYAVYCASSFVSFKTNNILTNGTLSESYAGKIQSVTKGNSSDRPSFNNSVRMRGYMYYCTNLGYPIFYHSDSEWRLADGTIFSK